MKKAILSLLLLPLGLLAQNITNTLGPSGVFTVEDNSNNSIIQAQRPSPGATRIIFGDYSNSFNLPTGDVDFVHNEGTERVNIVVGRSGAFSAFPKLGFFYTPGSLTSPLTVTDQSTLGIINFGGYVTGHGWREEAFIKVEVQGTPNVDIPTRMIFGTKGGSAFNNMIFDNAGNLTVPGAVTSQAIKTIAAGDLTGGVYSATISDQTILSTVGCVAQLPVVGANDNGKTITIKNVTGGSGTINITGSSIYDADEFSISNNSIDLFHDGEFVTLAYNHSTTSWYVVAKNLLPRVRTTASGPINVQSTDQAWIVTGATTFTLPTIASVPIGKTYTFKKGSSNNFTITINGNGANIDGSASNVFGVDTEYNSITIISDGTAWWVISQF